MKIRRCMRNWWKHQQKLYNARQLKEDRMEMYKQLIDTGEKYRHLNQWK